MRKLTPEQEKRFWQQAYSIASQVQVRLAHKPKWYPENLVVNRAVRLVDVYYGGFWRAWVMLALVRIWEWLWHHQPKYLLADLWIWFGDRTGRYVDRDGERHACDCKYPPIHSDDEAVIYEHYIKHGEDNCIHEAMPKFLRNWVDS